MKIIGQIQLGKNGITDSFISSLEDYFKNCQNVRVSVLKNCCRDRTELKKISQEILDKLGKNYTTKVIGFTIVVKKWRKARV